jgi:hypothetical protein
MSEGIHRVKKHDKKRDPEAKIREEIRRLSERPWIPDASLSHSLSRSPYVGEPAGKRPVSLVYPDGRSCFISTVDGHSEESEDTFWLF